MNQTNLDRKYWDDVWVGNSLGIVVPVGNFTVMLYFDICLAVVILVHSWIINGLRFRVLRICTEIAAWSTLFQSSYYLACTNTEATDDYAGNSCDIRISAYLFDAIGVGLAGTLTQMSDNFVVYHRYSVLTGDSSNRSKLLTLSYLGIFMYCTFWPFYTFLPWITNLNGTYNLNIFMIMIQYILFPAYCAYNLFFTGTVLLRLKKLMKSSAMNSERRHCFRILALKAIAHNIISAGAIAAYSFSLTYGTVIYNAAVTFSLHVCLNWKFEKWASKRKQKRLSAKQNSSFGRGDSGGVGGSPGARFIDRLTGVVPNSPHHSSTTSRRPSEWSRSNWKSSRLFSARISFLSGESVRKSLRPSARHPNVAIDSPRRSLLPALQQQGASPSTARVFPLELKDVD